jgi:transposase-like protein
MARPSKNNPTGAQKKLKKTLEVITLLKQAFSIGATDEEACKHAGICTATLYVWRNEDEKLAEEFDRLKNNPILKAKKTIVDNLGDPQNARWYLERKCRNEFAQRVENDHTSTDGTMSPTRIEIVAPQNVNSKD